MADGFFPPRPTATPTIYAFASMHQDHAGLLKVGYTKRIAAERFAGHAALASGTRDMLRQYELLY